MRHNFWRAQLLTLAVITLTMATASAQYTATTLYNFGSSTNDAEIPTTGLIFDSAGNLYGSTNLGGTGAGTVYELSPDGSGGWTETILFTFTLNTGAPARPNGNLILDAAGNLYGVSQAGGPNNQGTVYELSPGSSGWTLTDLYDFAGGAVRTTTPWQPHLRLHREFVRNHLRRRRQHQRQLLSGLRNGVRTVSQWQRWMDRKASLRVYRWR